MALDITVRDGAIRFSVHVQPRSSRDAIEGLHGDALKVRLTAPPVEGAANAALVSLLADALGVARRDVRIVTGESGRHKLVEVAGIAPDAVMRLASRGKG